MGNIKIGFWNVDRPVDQKNVEKIKGRMEVVDAIVVTTGGEWLKKFIRQGSVVSFTLKPRDPGSEKKNNSERDNFDIDLMFGEVGNVTDPRYSLVEDLHREVRKGRFRTFGMYGDAAVRGVTYEDVLEASKMALDLNGEEGNYLYSSARSSQLMGNGLLTFLSAESGYQRFFAEEEAVFFNDKESLIRQIYAFQNDDTRRKAIAGAGWAFYHRHFSAKDVAQYTIETTFGMPYSKDYIWRDELYRS